jgi:phage shock protein C
MKKTINIDLAGRMITIDQKALQMHLAYIETLHGYFINEEGRFEIINDIEDRISELMCKIINSPAACISKNDMENIIRAMGTIDEFKELDEDDWDTSPEEIIAGTGQSAINSFYILTENMPPCLEGSDLCYN